MCELKTISYGVGTEDDSRAVRVVRRHTLTCGKGGEGSPHAPLSFPWEVPTVHSDLQCGVKTVHSDLQ